MTTRAYAWIACCWLLSAACQKTDCPGADPGPTCATPPDTPTGCTSNDECAAPTAVCDIPSGTCVECTTEQAEACVGATPVCGDDLACRGCAAHTDCDLLACLPDGGCGDDTTVAYVDPMGSDNDQCTQAMPCTTIAKALATGRPFVKLTGMLDEAVTIEGGQVVTFLASPGTQLTRTAGAGAIVTVRDDDTSLTIFDLTITNAPNNPSGIGIVIPTASGAPSLTVHRSTLSNNPGGGISASGGSVTISQSTITGNTGGGISASGGSVTISQSTITGNTGGGISVSGAEFDITNNIIAKNGGPSSAFGGVLVSQITAAGSHRFEFNTVTQNQASVGITPGVVCAVVATPLAFANSIVFGNGAGTQVEGSNCTWTFSDVGPDTVTGTGNFNEDPLFVDPVQGDFHVMATAEPAATLAFDVDDEPRPQGDGRDVGADEVP